MRDLNHRDVNRISFCMPKPLYFAVLPLIAGMLLLTNGCRNNGNDSGGAVQENLPGNQVSNADLIRNPVSAEAPQDTAGLPRIQLDQTFFDFGEIPDDKIVRHDFEFQNTGKTPLVIARVRGSCGCTVPHWPKDPIPPGGKGKIEVRFDPSGKEGPQSKPITITANTYPNTTNIYVSARVKPASSSDGSNGE